MGGDLGPQPSLEAALVCLDSFPRLRLQWIGPANQLQGMLAQVPASQQHLLPRIFIIGADDVVELADDVLVALRQKQDSSMSIACLLYTSPSPRDLSTARMPASA